MLTQTLCNCEQSLKLASIQLQSDDINFSWSAMYKLYSVIYTSSYKDHGIVEQHIKQTEKKQL